MAFLSFQWMHVLLDNLCSPWEMEGIAVYEILWVREELGSGPSHSTTHGVDVGVLLPRRVQVLDATRCRRRRGNQDGTGW